MIYYIAHLSDPCKMKKRVGAWVDGPRGIFLYAEDESEMPKDTQNVRCANLIEYLRQTVTIIRKYV